MFLRFKNTSPYDVITTKECGIFDDCQRERCNCQTDGSTLKILGYRKKLANISERRVKR